MSRMLIGTGMAVAATMLGSDFVGGFPKTPRPGEGQKRARDREDLARLEREKQGPPDPAPVKETRQQRRARERQAFKRLPRHD